MPVERCLRGDLLLLALVLEAPLVDRELEVLGHLVAVDVPADALADQAGGLALQTSARRVDGGLYLREQVLGRRKQLLPPLPALLGDVRVAADEQALARKLGR